MLRRSRTPNDAPPRLKRRHHGSGGFDTSDVVELESELQNWISQPRPLLGELLLDDGIDAETLATALREQHDHGGRLGDILIASGLLNEQQLGRALSQQFQIPMADLTQEHPEPDAVHQLSGDIARKLNALPLKVVDERLYVVVADPLDLAAIRELAEHCGNIALLLGTETDISRSIDQAYNALLDAAVHIKAFELVEADDISENLDTLQVDENAPIVQVVNRIVTQGVRNRASDIHIEPMEKDIRVRYRIDGTLTDAIHLPAKMGSPLASRIKVLAELNIVERRRPQDGQFSVSVDGRPIDVRTSTVATVHGEKVVMRLLDKTRSLISLRELGMPSGVTGPYLQIVKAPLGMMLCTGPTGSGKTTTLYATLNEINDDRRNVVTIEDPVEYQFDGVNQMQINEQAGITFADGLRGILRQDPDVILVGEIRDIETARIATQAALTGHFVLSSLHAIDAVAALHRFTDMGIEPFLVASAINGVIGQRLIRKICNGCRSVYTPSADQVRLVELHGGRRPDVWMKGTGCNICNHTGYSGRVGVYELLQVSEAVRELIVTKATHVEIRKVAMAEGMRTMQQEAFRLVLEGTTTVEEVVRSVYAPSAEGEGEHAPMELMPGPAAIGASNVHPIDPSAVDIGEESA